MTPAHIVLDPLARERYPSASAYARPRASAPRWLRLTLPHGAAAAAFARCRCRFCMLPALPCSLAACERRCPLRRCKKPLPPFCAPCQAEPMRQSACAPRRGIFCSVRSLRDDQRPTALGPLAPTLAHSLSLAGLDRARNSWLPSPPWTPVNTATSRFPNSRNLRPPAPIPRTHRCAQLSCSPWK